MVKKSISLPDYIWEIVDRYDTKKNTSAVIAELILYGSNVKEQKEREKLNKVASKSSTETPAMLSVVRVPFSDYTGEFAEWP